ncbi:MAG: hypothetical protein WAO93_04180 [Orrella sp.]|uniref:hypothetical protein n=1 Tax=Orrella sp. TaxID=1921583 RepID=UPI003BEAB61E
MTDLEQRSWAVTGALSVAPRSIQCARDGLVLLVIMTGLFSVFYLGLSYALCFGLGFVFLVGFVFWRFYFRRPSNAGATSHDVLRVTETGIDVIGCSSPIVLQGVIRHWAGITLLCRSHENHRVALRRLTLWKEQFEPEQYRRLNVLVNWLIRGQA